MRRFEHALWCLGLASCHAAPAQVLFGLPAQAGSASAERASSMAAAGSGSDVLRVQLEVSDPAPRCGECMEMSARASGGVPPYTFTWSDPTFIGPGPHTVCPAGTCAYLVLLTDARSTVIDTGSAVLTCTTPARADAGASASMDMPPPSTCVGRAQTDTGVMCQTDVVGLMLSRSITLSQPLLPGVSYSALLSLQSIQATISSGMAFRIYGARTPCEPEQLLGSFSLNASVSAYGACFVPDQAYDHVIAVTDTGAVALTVLDGMSFCNVGCAPDAQ